MQKFRGHVFAVCNTTTAGCDRQAIIHDARGCQLNASWVAWSQAATCSFNSLQRLQVLGV